MLQAAELGIGTCWINTLRRTALDPGVHAFLKTVGLGEQEEITGGLAVGYPEAPLKIHAAAFGNEAVWL